MEEFGKGCLRYLLHVPLMRMEVYGLGLVFMVPMEFSQTLEWEQIPMFNYTTLRLEKYVYKLNDTVKNKNYRIE